MSGWDVGERSARWVELNQQYVTAALAVLQRRVNGSGVGGADDAALAEVVSAELSVRSAMEDPPAIDAIESAFGLSRFERDVLLLCAGTELDTAVADACAAAHGHPGSRYATFGLALSTLSEPHWSALTPAAALRRWHLVEVVHPETPTTSPLRIDERVLHAIAGVSYLDPRIAPILHPISPPMSLHAGARDAAARVVGIWTTPRPSQATPARVQLYGRRAADLRAVAAEAAAALGLQPVMIRASDLPEPAADREFFARICAREAALGGLAIVLDVDDATPASTVMATDFAAQLSARVVLIAQESLPGPDPRPICIAVPRPAASQSRAVWVDALGPSSVVLNGWLDRVVGQFDLATPTAQTVAAQVRPLLETTRPNAEAVGRLLWESCRDQARPSLDRLTQRITPHSRWSDLVLPNNQLRTLHLIALHVHHRLRVHENWGFAERTSRGLGTAALFAGPSGTGKTLAAEILAADLGLDLYRIDLSQVVSKYIGETEKNLRTVFDAADAGGAVLLFDEADALFGKRSEVRDSHDRYANIEVSYLLQRMEAYRGLAVLTTNMRGALDPAFLRRLRFVVQFPFPNAEQREEIWRRAFPDATPTDGLDPRKLAALTVSGGTIANIALLAAFIAAADDELVRMAHILTAARIEYAKLERPLTDKEVRGWLQ